GCWSREILVDSRHLAMPFISMHTTGPQRMPIGDLFRPSLKERTKMATKTIARPRTPGASEDNARDPADLLENTLSQLEALLWVCHGEDIDWCSGSGPRQLDNLLWLAAELTRKAGELFQMNEKARKGASETGG
ncbi:hypothetical protein ACSFBI_29360, partial [Variovorax sp. RB3P1]|uniref:hypothetical protein n=1 Tax=Variovorax sp. RB3P1 TaxID=3443732 RepID=UPI003F44C689